MHALRAAPQFSREQQARDLMQIFEQVMLTIILIGSDPAFELLLIPLTLSLYKK